MSLIDEIRHPINEELHIFKKTFADALETNNPLLLNIIKYILEGTGKQLRPLLVILSAKLCGEVTLATYNGALSLELLHNASLIHDDVVDDTYERRGRSSINARWTNKIAVLTGDYLLSNALISATRTRNLEILNSVSQIGMELSDGELIQLSSSQQSKINEEDYFKIIRKKTALLFATCTEVGGLSVNADQKSLKHLRQFGEFMGLCFQIKDDIFDYYHDIEIGKPTGNDLQDGKITLPLIYALKNSSDSEKEKVMMIIDTKDFTNDNIDYIMRFAHEKGGVDYAVKRMNDFKNDAIAELESFADSDVKQSLIKCAEFAASRKN
ncbi:MAG TPA: polyprenyl synthetase family protein [Paludibacter sp.]|nr:polyprenyl synthetase family protein [Paludibacter sp.]